MEEDTEAAPGPQTGAGDMKGTAMSWYHFMEVLAVQQSPLSAMIRFSAGRFHSDDLRSRSSVRKTGRGPSVSAGRRSSTEHKLFPSSVGRSSVEASVQMRTAALQAPTLNYKLASKRDAASGTRVSAGRRPSLQLLLCPLVLVQTQQTFRRWKADSTDERKSSDVVRSRAAFSEISTKSFLWGFEAEIWNIFQRYRRRLSQDRNAKSVRRDGWKNSIDSKSQAETRFVLVFQTRILRRMLAGLLQRVWSVQQSWQLVSALERSVFLIIDTSSSHDAFGCLAVCHSCVMKSQDGCTLRAASAVNDAKR